MSGKVRNENQIEYYFYISFFYKKAIFLNFTKIVIESYAYRLYALKLEWKQPEPIQYSDKLALASFSLAGNLFKETCQRNYLTGNFRKALFFLIFNGLRRKYIIF